MYKIQTLLIFLLTTFTSYSQDRILVYKAKADKVISAYFDQALIPKIKCTDVAIEGLDSTLIYFSDYEHTKNKKEKLLTVTFFYSYYSKELNYVFNFDITIDRQKNIQSDSTLFIEIPNCIAKKLDCNYISKDSAIKIAIKDGILYPNNLVANLNKYYNSNNYFWFVTGSAKVKKTDKRTVVKRNSTKHQRIINAITGKIVPYNEYFKHQ